MTAQGWWLAGRVGGTWAAVLPQDDALTLYALSGPRRGLEVLAVAWDDVLSLHAVEVPRRRPFRRRPRTLVVLTTRTGALQLLVPGTVAGVRGAMAPYLVDHDAMRRLAAGIDAGSPRLVRAA